MIYIPVDINKPISSCKQITVQLHTTNNFPDIVFELHDKNIYFDLGDNCSVYGCLTNTYGEIVRFSGTLSILNPHRGQILCKPIASDFTHTGFTTLTILCDIDDDVSISFQTTIFVDSLSHGVYEILDKERGT